MGLEEQESVVITVDDQVIGKGNAQYHQRASQKDLSVLPFCAVTAEYRMFSPSSEENPALNLLINERNYPCLIDTGATFLP